LCRFDDPNKVDINNSTQFELIYKHMQYCMEVVFFWTNTFVNQVETKQFRHKRATNAWHVCEGKALGFSGTNDNRELLPSFVQQIPPKEDHLRATNGGMVRLILETAKRVCVLENGMELPLWQCVIKKSVELKVRALIDVSGLMAGAENKNVAVHLSRLLDRKDFSGVVYFDQSLNGWYLYENDNSRAVPLQSSTFSEAECFIFFDQSRCRGSDMKLPTTATALVTIEPKLTKDRFLQGCARMRKLNGGQSLILAGTSEVVNEHSTATEILERIVHHTAAVTKKGVFTFFERGRDYFRFPTPIEDDISLTAMYSGPRGQYHNFEEYFEATMEVQTMSDEREITEREIAHTEYCKDIGDSAVDTAMLSGECEQELEQEAEKQSEAERKIPRQLPFCQITWDFEKAFTEPDQLFARCFITLKGFVNTKLPKIASIDWGKDIFCSPNFWRTIQGADAENDLSCFVRPVNAMLVTQDGRVALLSMFDTDQLLPIWWALGDNNKAHPRARLMHLCLTESGEGFGRDDEQVPEAALTLVKLFRGYVGFSPTQQTILRSAFRGVDDPRAVALGLLHMRYRQGYFDRSDLEIVSTLPKQELATAKQRASRKFLRDPPLMS
jgi:hypothetical protein